MLLSCIRQVFEFQSDTTAAISDTSKFIDYQRPAPGRGSEEHLVPSVTKLSSRYLASAASRHCILLHYTTSSFSHTRTSLAMQGRQRQSSQSSPVSTKAP